MNRQKIEGSNDGCSRFAANDPRIIVARSWMHIFYNSQVRLNMGKIGMGRDFDSESG